MASAFSQSTFLSADHMEPSPPPAKGARAGRGSHEPLTLFLPLGYLPGPCAGTSNPELDREVSLAQGCWLPCRLLFGSWRWQELLVLPRSIHWGTGAGPGLRKHFSASCWEGRTVSAEWGWGLQEHLPLLSLALEMAKEGPRPWMQQSSPQPRP